jgi:hypothetical protein
MQCGDSRVRMLERPLVVPLTAVLAMAAAAFSAAELTVRRSGEEIRIIAPRMRLLEGRTLDRLHNGMVVRFEFQLSVLGEGKRSVLKRTSTRFVMSYDLWEEKFSVVRVTGTPRSVSHLSATNAETWCVDQLSLEVSDFAPQQAISLRLDVRAEDLERRSRDGADSSLSLSDLVDIFSRTGRTAQQRWTFESGPFRPGDLKAGTG